MTCSWFMLYETHWNLFFSGMVKHFYVEIRRNQILGISTLSIPQCFFSFHEFWPVEEVKNSPTSSNQVGFMEILSGISDLQGSLKAEDSPSSSNGIQFLGTNCWFFRECQSWRFGVVFLCVFGGTWNAFEPFSSPSRTGLVSLVAVCRTPRRKARDDSHVEAFFKKRQWDTAR